MNCHTTAYYMLTLAQIPYCNSRLACRSNSDFIFLTLAPTESNKLKRLTCHWQDSISISQNMLVLPKTDKGLGLQAPTTDGIFNFGYRRMLFEGFVYPEWNWGAKCEMVTGGHWGRGFCNDGKGTALGCHRCLSGRMTKRKEEEVKTDV